MTNLVVTFKGASDETFYKMLRALTQMRGKGIGKVKFGERYDIGWSGEVQFLSREAMEIFGTKIRRGGRK